MPTQSFTGKIGVLALQGAFAKHQEVFAKLGVPTIQVRIPKELEQCDGLVIPGGESSTIYRQMDFIHLIESVKQFSKSKPVFGTCAGLILMSSQIENSTLVKPFGLLDISVERNAYGRQIESFRAKFEVSFISSKKEWVEAFFIRAPRIRQCGSEVRVLATYQNEPVLVQQGIHLGATFHAELVDETCLHEYYLSLVRASIQNKTIGSNV
ncbi:MAG: pyridoxal 5'-phosphate synthase glutaminase subunit PdxT [Parachlamydiaceae bacterium]